MSRRILQAWYRGRYDDAARPERSGIRQWTADRMLAALAGRLGLRTDFIERRKLALLAHKTERLAPTLRTVSDDELRHAAAALRAALLREGLTDPLAARCFALVSELSERILGKRHHRVQLMGGFGLLRGRLVEMATGEGKTLTALLPTVAVALSGLPVHVVTVNEYLARRDAALLQPVLSAFGLSVATVTHAESDHDRRLAYASDVVFAVNKDIVFDYLRDRIDLDHAADPATSAGRHRGLYFALIDEADSVLIDEARTPLIIAREVFAAGDLARLRDALRLAQMLEPELHFERDDKRHGFRLKASGRLALDDLADGGSDLWPLSRVRDEMVEQALSACFLYRRGEHYVVHDERIQIVDEFTGRILPDRTWERGLHQLIELREGCSPTPPRETIARLTYPQFFSRYLRMAGMTGTGAEVAGELRANYGVQVVRIPTHRPCVRRHLGTRVFTGADLRWAYVAERAGTLADAGRAVLIGTRSVQASQKLSDLLLARGTPHVVLNAVQDEFEADVVAQAGTPGRITVATNMAGRGTDIPLHERLREHGGLHVILTEFHESSRIDRQLFGRAARQGDPGSCEACASLDDELFVRHAGWLVRHLRWRYARATQIPGYWAVALRALAQWSAEGRYASIRRQAADRDHQMSKALSFTGAQE